jgi:hypothetical protein
MGFWSKLLGKKDAKLELTAVDGDGDGKVQDGTIWERPDSMTVDLDETIKRADALLKDIGVSFSVSPELEKKRKRQEAAKKSAATRAANKANAEANGTPQAKKK